MPALRKHSRVSARTSCGEAQSPTRTTNILGAKFTGAGRRRSTAELRLWKPDRQHFLGLPRQPITLLLDGVHRNYNLGAIFRLADAFMLEQLIICGTLLDLRKRKLVQAARGTQHWVPWVAAKNAASAVAATKAVGAWVLVVEQTSSSLPPEAIMPTFPICLVLGSEGRGVSQDIIDVADAAVSIPMLGMGNSLNVASAAAIILYWLTVHLRRSIPRPSDWEAST
jgi:tRNA G18 (ribose-2'-O)-methylase SpoU